MKILCVAEKPSIAKSVSGILSEGQMNNRAGKDKYCRNFDFSYNMAPYGRVDITMTSVRGHLTELDFHDRYRKWSDCTPLELFTAPVEVQIPKDKKLIAANLKEEARGAQMLMIWTDCDREGEHIGQEVVNVCRGVNRGIEVKRARFSAIIPNQIHNACRNPVALDTNAASAVDARQELDLRIGAAFTRMQTLELQRMPELDGNLISYGPCQFPTLGFVVDQYQRVNDFIPEPFWHIDVTHQRNEGADGNGALRTVKFSWQRNRLFDNPIAVILHQACLEEPMATVIKVQTKPTKKWKPYPLTTVELQKSGSRLLHLSPKVILEIAEKLYNQGFVSYPRTETDQYDPAFDFRSLIAKQDGDAAWGPFATMLNEGGFERPRNGRKNDEAHPPIHPTAHVANLTGNEKKVYDYITRRFLASCSKDALGKQIIVEIRIASEVFSATGLTILQRNYLEVFVYDRWEGNLLPEYTQGEHFVPTSCTLQEGRTTAPKLLTEADLVSLMDKNGIGTDATIAEHIDKVINREYIMRQKEGRITYLLPSTLGSGLVDGYNRIDFEKSLSKPQLRRETEFRMKLICDGRSTKQETVNESIEEYVEVFRRAQRDLATLKDSVRRFLTGTRADEGDASAGPSAQDRGDSGDDDNNAGGGGGGGGGGGPPASRGRGLPRGSGPARGGRAAVPAPTRRPTRNVQPPPPRDDGDDNNGGPPGGAGALTVRRASAGARGPPGASSNVLTPTQLQPLIVITDSDLEDFDNDGRDDDKEGGQKEIVKPQCSCSTDCVQFTVKKEGPNNGRQFWRCPDKDNGCGFFEWDDDDDDVDGREIQGSKKRTAPKSTKSNRSAQPVAQLPDKNMACSCSEPAVQRTVVKDGPNTGRKFWVCAKLDTEDRCKFFEWSDESAGGAVAGPSAVAMGECYKCGQNGHWAKDCRSKATSAPKGNGTTGTCFNCGEAGHWSNACPGVKQPYKEGRSGYDGRSSSGGESSSSGMFRGQARKPQSYGQNSTCRKCGSWGHWANNCTG